MKQIMIPLMALLPCFCFTQFGDAKWIGSEQPVLYADYPQQFKISWTVQLDKASKSDRLTLQPQDVEGFVQRQLQAYPQLRLLDLYKSCFQDFMGAEHLVSDRQRVKAYLDEELNTTALNDLMPWNYEPCGIDSNYYRVSIRTIKENVLSEEMLLDAFIRSANSKRPAVESWRDRWHVIVGVIDQMQLGLPHYQQDKVFIDSILSAGKYAISHSPEYREAYRPHYRIVERGIFERELKPLIEHKH